MLSWGQYVMGKLSQMPLNVCINVTLFGYYTEYICTCEDTAHACSLHSCWFITFGSVWEINQRACWEIAYKIQSAKIKCFKFCRTDCALNGYVSLPMWKSVFMLWKMTCLLDEHQLMPLISTLCLKMTIYFVVHFDNWSAICR